jgi:hypothetical protein
VAGATGHKVFRAVGTGAATEVASLGATAATHADATAVAGTVYTYTVKAVTAAGTSAASASNTGWRNVAAPSGVSATDGTSTANVTVTWTAVPGATGHKVFRAVGTAAATQVASLGATAATYADTTAAAGTVCTYTVKATTAAGDSAASAADTGWRNVAAPTGLAATDGTFPDKVRLTWTVHASTAVTGYRVLRRLPSETEFALITTISSRTTVTHDDFDIPATVVGTYVVQGVTAAGATDSSTSNTGFRQGAPPAGAPPAGAPPADDVPPPEGGTAGNDPPPGMAPPAAATGPGPSAGHGTSGAGQGGEGPSTDNGDEDDGNEPDDGQSGDRCFDLAGRIVLLLIRPTPPEAYGRADELDDLLTRVPGTDATSSPVASDSVACLMLRGDLTLDGRVDSLDALCFTAAWCSQDAYLADLDRDGCITELDLDAMIDALEGSSGDIGDLEPLRP